MRLSFNALCTLIAFLVAPSVAAQAPLGVGDRVRTTTDEGRAVGVIVEASQDTIYVSYGDALAPRSLTSASLQSLEVRGPRSRMEGALLGAGIGLAISGAAVAIVYLSASPADGWEAVAALGLAILVTPPLVVGSGVIGALHPGQRWHRVQVRGSLGLTPGFAGVNGSGPGVTLRIEW